MPSRLVLVVAALALVIACGMPRPEPLASGSVPTSKSASHATFTADQELVAGGQIPADHPLTLTITLARDLPRDSQIIVYFPTAVQEETDALWSVPTTKEGEPGFVHVSGGLQIIAA